MYNALRRRMQRTAQLSPDGDQSLQMWKSRLEARGYAVIYQKVSAQASGENLYIFGWVSPWQQKVCSSCFDVILRFQYSYTYESIWTLALRLRVWTPRTIRLSPSSLQAMRNPFFTLLYSRTRRRARVYRLPLW